METHQQASLVSNQEPIYPQFPQPIMPIPPQEQVVEQRKKCPFAGKCKCKGRFHKYFKNHRQVLKVNLFIYLVLSILGILLTTPIVTVLRLISSITGLRCLKKNSPVMLIVFGGMCVYDIALTLCAPYIQTVFRSSILGNRPAIYATLLSILHSLIILIPQIICFSRTVKYYREEKKRLTEGEDVVEPENIVEEEQEPQIPLPTIPEGNDMNQSLIVTLPPPPVNEPIKEEIQTPVVSAQPEVDYSVQLNLLKEMGFDNEIRNTQLLNQFKGNVQAVISNFINQ